MCLCVKLVETPEGVLTLAGFSPVELDSSIRGRRSDTDL